MEGTALDAHFGPDVGLRTSTMMRSTTACRFEEEEEEEGSMG